VNGLRRFGPLLAVGLLLVAAAVAAMLASPQIHATRLPKPPWPDADKTPPPAQGGGPDGIVTAAPAPAERSIALPGWLVVTAQVLCVLVTLVAVGLLAWYLLRHGLRMRQRREKPGAAATPAQAREQVIAAVDAGLSDLDDADADPRRVVIACWVRLEQAAAAAGTPRNVGDTPTELVTRLLAGHAVSAAVLYRLAEVYRLARYATHTVDTSMRDQARAALGQLRAELSREKVAA
jgi:Domain of unknown function (DUF4129)